MPLNATALPQPDIEVIRQWIINGAVDDRVQPSSPIKVMSLSPPPGAPLDMPPLQIIAGFYRDLDASTVNAMTFIVESSGGVALVSPDISVPVANPRAAVFDLTGVTMVDDTYTIRLLGDGASVIMDQDGNALDGERNAAFPSGNNAAGGDYVAQFTIATPVVLVPTLASIQATVFTPTCASAACHDAVAPAGGMDLSSEAASFMNLVNVDSVGQPGTIRVVPGQPNNSFLIQRIDGTVAPRMPLGGSLTPEVIANIALWITNGAAP
jgi:hypothetical protein